MAKEIRTPLQETEATGRFLHLTGAGNQPLGVEHIQARNSREEVVVMLHGAFRNTDELKFKRLALALARQGIDSLLVDERGKGLSKEYGKALEFTVENARKDLTAVLDAFSNETNRKPIGVFAHSRGGLVGLQYKDAKVSDLPLVMMGPPLQTVRLVKFWGVQFERKKALVKQKKSGGPKINDDQMRAILLEHLDEDLKKADEREDETILRPLKSQTPFAEEALRTNYLPIIENYCEDLWLIYGDRDHVVPAQSLPTEAFKANQLTRVAGGDHEMETEAALRQWLLPTTNFLASKK